jgi:hypothetical protein
VIVIALLAARLAAPRRRALENKHQELLNPLPQTVICGVETLSDSCPLPATPAAQRRQLGAGLMAIVW